MESIKFLMIIFHSVIGVYIWRIESDVLDYRKIPFFCFHENKPYHGKGVQDYKPAIYLYSS